MVDVVDLLIGGGVGAGLGGGLGYFLGNTSVFTNMGVPDTKPNLVVMLVQRGYTTDMLTKLESASIWELQCLVAAHLIAEAYGLSVV